MTRAGTAPALLVALRRYPWATFTADVGAGLTVALLSLPLAMAFAIAAGAPPEHGLACAVVAGTIASAGGASRVRIAGPSGAVVVLVAGILTTHGPSGLLLATLTAGGLLIALGLAGLGDALRFLPRAVVVGVTNGVAILLAATQLRAAPVMDWPSAALGAGALAVIGACAFYRTRIPGPIVALVAGTVVTAAAGLPVATIASRAQAFPSSWPAFTMPALRPDQFLALLPAAFAIALLAAIESLRAAEAGDRLGGDRHNANVELVAIGLANVAAPLAGGLPAAGGVARTVAAIRAGARTPVAGLVQALAILAVVGWAAPYAGLVPMPVLAAIVLSVAWTAGAWTEVRDVVHAGPVDAGVWAVTVAVTVLADLTQAVPVALALGGLLFIRRVASTIDAAEVSDEATARQRAEPAADQEIPPFVAAFRVTGPLLFGGTDALDVVRDRLDGLPPIVVLRVRHMTAVDAAGLDAIEDLARAVRATDRVFLVAGARDQPLALMRRAHFERRLGPDHVCPTFDDALTRARKIHADRFSGAWPNVAAPVPAPLDNRPESGDEAIAHIR